MAVGQFIGPYQILRQINRGGQGRVLLGYDPRLHRRVAIKIYSLPMDRRGKKQALAEARLIAGLDSPRIVRIFDVIVVPNHLAMVMEYVPGCDLEEVLQVQPIAIPAIVAIAQDVTAAIAVARQNRVVHGDIKAANVLLGNDGRAKLSDFGISRRAFHAGGRAGSPLSVAPEQVSGAPLDVRTDLFALGCLLFRMLTGRHAYPGLRLGSSFPPANETVIPDVPPTFEAVSASREKIPDELANLVSALLQPGPAARPQNTHEVRRVLRAVNKGLPLTLARDLRQEVQQNSRAEALEELPPEIPAPFQGSQTVGTGRSLLSLPGRSRWRLWSRSAVLCFCLIAVSLFWQYLRRPHLDIVAPVISVVTDRPLPADLSRDWLVERLTQATTDAFWFVDVTNGSAPTTSDGQLKLELRCRDEFCVLSVSLAGQREIARKQVVLFPDAPMSAWQEALDEAAASVLAAL